MNESGIKEQNSAGAQRLVGGVTSLEAESPSWDRDRKPGRGLPRGRSRLGARLTGQRIRGQSWGSLSLSPTNFLPHIPGSPEGTSPHHSDPLVLLHLISQSHISGTPHTQTRRVRGPAHSKATPPSCQLIAGGASEIGVGFRFVYMLCCLHSPCSPRAQLLFQDPKKWGFIPFLGAFGG